MTLPAPSFNQEKDSPKVRHVASTFTKKARINEDKRFNCKVCCQNFTSQNELFQHRRLHEYCTFDGCKFNALDSVVAAHYQRAHVGNSSIKIQDLSTPEEIAKWREERKKRYPTVSNVLLRQQIELDKQQRCEKIENKRRFGDGHQSRFIKALGGNKNFNHNNSKKFSNSNKNRRSANQQKHETRNVEEICHKNVIAGKERVRQTPAFKGMEVQSLMKSEGALSLLAQYSSDEDESKLETTVRESETCETPDESLGPDEISIKYEPVEENGKGITTKNSKSINSKEFHKKIKRKTNNSLLDYSKLRKLSVNPFLENLLRNDIQHERNVLLQCVNFVVQNNFFDLEDTIKSSM